MLRIPILYIHRYMTYYRKVYFTEFIEFIAGQRITDLHQVSFCTMINIPEQKRV